MVDLLIDGPPDAKMTVALAHGAGLGFDAPFMKIVATGLAERDVRVVRFEFDYMAKRRLDGKRRPPDRPDRLMACWREVVTEIETERLVVAGKSMGGRIASMIADDVGAAGWFAWVIRFTRRESRIDCVSIISARYGRRR